jgi:hypothetical protein
MTPESGTFVPAGMRLQPNSQTYDPASFQPILVLPGDVK